MGGTLELLLWVVDPRANVALRGMGDSSSSVNGQTPHQHIMNSAADIVIKKSRHMKNNFLFLLLTKSKRQWVAALHAHYCLLKLQWSEVKSISEPQGLVQIPAPLEISYHDLT